MGRLKCFVWGITLGKNSVFWGKINVKRAVNSSITIGNKCQFKSVSWSNRVGINRPCFLSTSHPGAEITIGSNCGFSGVVIRAAKSITIGDNARFGANVTVTDTDDHQVDRINVGRKEQVMSSPIVIEGNVWLGMNVVVLKGVKIGEGAVVAANSVVTKDVPTRVVVGGIPAKIIRRIDN